MKRAVGWLVAAVGLWAVASLSTYRTAVDDASRSEFRLSWRSDGTSVEDCTEAARAEQEGLAEHMRNPNACVARRVPYALWVRIDGELRLRDTLHAPGARGDRPLYVFAELPVTPGRHRVAVDFSPVWPEAPVPPDVAATAPVLDVDTTLTFPDGRAVLLTMDETGAPRLRTPSEESDPGAGPAPGAPAAR
ncbi:MAG: hypothetical protein D6701_05855 [Gemmatimonadetes bacterium]|nr:MAG: hypothetical protein D6701_05855 [Gemmatimonadota bacterium]